MKSLDNQVAGPIVVIGGTGKTGSRVLEKLEAKGVDVRSASRSGPVPFDWRKPGTWADVVAGAKSIYITFAPDLAVPGSFEAISAFVDLAVREGVQRLVLLSGRGEDEAQRCEKIVMESGAEWTVVRASWFSQNFSEGEFSPMVQQGVIALPAGKVAEPFIDIEDIADVVVAALVQPGHSGEVYEVTGPRLLTFSQVAQELALATGREVRYVPISLQSFSQGLEENNAPAEMRWLLEYLMGTVLDGRNAQLADGVQRALGREPRDFRQFAQAVAETGVWEEVA
uniref:NAD(P)H-binding protein n=1 Tax=Marinobacterium profundum TaxID=1714300 RepID=UPI00083175DC|nr:NAD(P)H-binding protein [Marinobacterium profundum]